MDEEIEFLLLFPFIDFLLDHSFMHSFSRYVFSTYCVPCMLEMLGTQPQTKQIKIPVFRELWASLHITPSPLNNPTMGGLLSPLDR